MTQDPSYVGRFAPSPTGPLHLGSLYAALASYLDAKAHSGLWLVRIDDLDPPRESKEASQSILATLEAYGLHWDGPVRYASQQHGDYQQALDQLTQKQAVFYCRCSRKQLAGLAQYPGTCHPCHQPTPDSAAKFYAPLAPLTIKDRLLGQQHWDVEQAQNFVVRRRDGLWAYQLACVVDDQLSGVTHVVRGFDILDSTPYQLALQQTLGYRPLNYAHLPLITHQDGQKLSKQNHARAIQTHEASKLIHWCLGQMGLEQIDLDTPEQMLKAAIAQWQLTRLNSNAIQEPTP